MTNYASKLVTLVMVGLPGCCFVKRVVVYSVFCPLMLGRDKTDILSFSLAQTKVTQSSNYTLCSFAITSVCALYTKIN